ncbi:MAG: hypothetical protein Q8M94_21285 [Ignavibacteria bacterium]|nr:hypothetical protein [Ignavibacteria bacterium]
MLRTLRNNRNDLFTPDSFILCINFPPPSSGLFSQASSWEKGRILYENNYWNKLELMFTNIAHLLNNAGADCVLMASNTPHLIADKIRKNKYSFTQYCRRDCKRDNKK